MAKAVDYGATGLWTRINGLNSPWALEDVIEIVGQVGDGFDVIMLPTGRSMGLGTSIISTSCWRSFEARHMIAEKADPDPRHPGNRRRASMNVEAIAAASPRLHGMSFAAPPGSRRLARHEDDARRRRPSRI